MLNGVMHFDHHKSGLGQPKDGESVMCRQSGQLLEYGSMNKEMSRELENKKNQCLNLYQLIYQPNPKDKE